MLINVLHDGFLFLFSRECYSSEGSYCHIEMWGVYRSREKDRPPHKIAFLCNLQLGWQQSIYEQHVYNKITLSVHALWKLVLLWPKRHYVEETIEFLFVKKNTWCFNFERCTRNELWINWNSFPFKVARRVRMILNRHINQYLLCKLFWFLYPQFNGRCSLLELRIQQETFKSERRVLIKWKFRQKSKTPMHLG